VVNFTLILILILEKDLQVDIGSREHARELGQVMHWKHGWVRICVAFKRLVRLTTSVGFYDLLRVLWTSNFTKI
jgi:hypothetical protein